MKENFSVSFKFAAFIVWLTLFFARVEAEDAQAKIEELKDQAYQESRVALQARNDSEMSELIQQREDQTREFEQQWNEHIKKLADSAEDDMKHLDTEHERALLEARSTIEGNLPTKYKPSAKLLDNRQVFDRLVQQKKYAEAHNLRAEIESMQEKEQQ